MSRQNASSGSASHVWEDSATSQPNRGMSRSLSNLSHASMDPYTRLLASLADAATNARTSLPRTTWGRVILAAVCIFLLSTSLIWIPCLIFAYCSAHALRILAWGIDTTSRAFVRAREKALASFDILLRYPPSPKTPRSRQDRLGPLSDNNFLASMFETLPGVDPQQAMKRIGSLSKFSLVATVPESDHAHDLIRDRLGSESADDTSSMGLSSGCESPLVSSVEGQTNSCRRRKRGAMVKSSRENSVTSTPVRDSKYISEKTLSTDGETTTDVLMELVKQGFIAVTGGSAPNSPRTAFKGSLFKCMDASNMNALPEANLLKSDEDTTPPSLPAGFHEL